MKKVILFAALAAGTFATAAAQEPIKFGARAGLNIDNATDFDSKVGFHLGAVADVPLANFAPSLPEWFYFQPGVYLTTGGGENKNGGVTTTINLYYLQVPLRASVRFSLADDIGVRLHFGPSIGAALSGKSEVKGSGQYDGSYDIFDDDDASRFRFGLDFGGGVEYKQFYVGLGYDLGLTKVFEDLTGSSFGITLGYNF